jgi:hypothetical protein
MNITRRILLGLGILLVNGMPAMDNDPSPEELVVQAITHGDWSRLVLLDPSRTLINKVLITTKLMTGEVVKLSALLHAVYTHNADMVGKLLAHGAAPIGKLDTAEQLTTPLQEAIKLNDTQMITQLKDAWLTLVQANRKDTQKMAESFEKYIEQDNEKLNWHTQEKQTPELSSEETSSKVAFAHAVITNNIQELQRIKLHPILVNTALVETTLASEEIVEISPLLYAVHTQNVPLMLKLLELGATPIGKWDSATQLSTPLQEARKSGNSAIIEIMRKAALDYVKQMLPLQIANCEAIIAPENKATHATVYQALGLDEQKLAQIKQAIHMICDINALLTLCSPQEIDVYLDLEDLLATNHALSLAIEKVRREVAEITKRSMDKSSPEQESSVDRIADSIRNYNITKDHELRSRNIKDNQQNQ